MHRYIKFNGTDLHLSNNEIKEWWYTRIIVPRMTARLIWPMTQTILPNLILPIFKKHWCLLEIFYKNKCWEQDKMYIAGLKEGINNDRIRHSFSNNKVFSTLVMIPAGEWRNYGYHSRLYAYCSAFIDPRHHDCCRGFISRFKWYAKNILKSQASAWVLLWS